MSRGETTRARILKAAEALFAKHGVAQTTLRAITSAARVNMAAVNYHFGSKERLAEDVFVEVARRANTQRIEMLDGVISAAASRGLRPSMAEIIRCFVHPYLNDQEPWTGLLLAHLILTRRVQPQPWARNAIELAHFDDMAQRFIDAFHQASGLSTAECYWRYYFMVSTMVLSTADATQSKRFQRLSNGTCNPADRAAMRREVCTYLVNAFQNAPAPAQESATASQETEPQL